MILVLVPGLDSTHDDSDFADGAHIQREFLPNIMRKNISGESPFEPVIGFSRAVRIDNHLHISGTGPVGAEALDAAGQTRRIFTIIAKSLAEAGATFHDVVRTRMYLTHAEDWETVGRVHGEYFGAIRPAATMVVVAKLLNPAWRVEIEMDAVIGAEPASGNNIDTNKQK